MRRVLMMIGLVFILIGVNTIQWKAVLNTFIALLKGENSVYC